MWGEIVRIVVISNYASFEHVRVLGVLWCDVILFDDSQVEGLPLQTLVKGFKVGYSYMLGKTYRRI